VVHRHLLDLAADQRGERGMQAAQVRVHGQVAELLRRHPVRGHLDVAVPPAEELGEEREAVRVHLRLLRQRQLALQPGRHRGLRDADRHPVGDQRQHDEDPYEYQHDPHSTGH
jgi:hypothetical protein